MSDETRKLAEAIFMNMGTHECIAYIDSELQLVQAAQARRDAEIVRNASLGIIAIFDGTLKELAERILASSDQSALDELLKKEREKVGVEYNRARPLKPQSSACKVVKLCGKLDTDETRPK